MKKVQRFSVHGLATQDDSSLLVRVGGDSIDTGTWMLPGGGI